MSPFMPVPLPKTPRRGATFCCCCVWLKPALRPSLRRRLVQKQLPGPISPSLKSWINKLRRNLVRVGVMYLSITLGKVYRRKRKDLRKHCPHRPGVEQRNSDHKKTIKRLFNFKYTAEANFLKALSDLQFLVFVFFLEPENPPSRDSAKSLLATID